MRIVLDGRCIQDHFPGIARYSYNLALALADELGRDELTVLIDSGAINRRFDLGKLAATPGIQVISTNAPVFSVLGLVRATVELARLQPDVYHSSYYVRPPLTPGRLVLTIFDLILERGGKSHDRVLSQSAARTAFRFAVSLGVRQASRVIVPSGATARDLRLLHAVAASRIATIPLGVDALFRPVDQKRVDELRERLSLPRRFILGLGVNKPHKNIEALVGSMAHLEKHSDVWLVLAGPIDRRFPDGAFYARQYGVSDRVSVLGQIEEPDLATLFSAATAFAYPSLMEGFGLPPIEAMACGTPVVCSDRGALPEVVGDAAVLIDPTDQPALANALARIIDDQPTRTSLIERGFRRAAELSWKAAATATWRIYREMVGAG